MNLQELSEYYHKELEQQLPEFEVTTQIDNRTIVITCIQDNSETKNYLCFDFWKGKGALHSCDCGVSALDIERILMPLLVLFGYIGKSALKNKYHNTFKSDSGNKHNAFDSTAVNTEDKADEQLREILSYINEVAMPFFKKTENIHDYFLEILNVDQEQLYAKLEPIGAIQRRMIIQYYVDKKQYKVAFEKYVDQYVAYYKGGMDQEAKNFLDLSKKLNMVLLENE